MRVPETLIAAMWIVSHFSADSGPGGAATLAVGGIHDDHAPHGTPYPLVIFRYQVGTYVNGLGGVRVVLNATYAIYAKVQSMSYDDAKPIAARLDALFHKASGVTADGRILSCVAESPLALPSVDNGLDYRALGAIYRIHIQGD